MIVGSLLLILVAVTLLVAGLAKGSSGLLISSIAASLLAAIALVVGARQAAAARAGGAYLGPPDDEPVRVDFGATAAAGEPDDGVIYDVVDDPVENVSPAESAPTMPVQAQSDPDYDDHDDGYDEDEDPPDEPAAQYVSPDVAARVAGLSSEVFVIDGRPRYHLPSCVHLLDRVSEALPVAEAVELGFSPCSLCEPDSALLAGARGG